MRKQKKNSKNACEDALYSCYAACLCAECWQDAAKQMSKRIHRTPVPQLRLRIS